VQKEFTTHKEAFNRLQDISKMLPQFITMDKEENFTINIKNDLNIQLDIEIDENGNISIKPSSDFLIDNKVLELIGARTFTTNNPDILVKLIKSVTEKNNKTPFNMFLEYYNNTAQIKLSKLIQ
jgi:hypothetical protein